ncbi:MAG: NADH-dependent alcohol dehydrogenase [Firmicutes bacterium HGW-Firmicutes-7]|nr:MAG: NADH-dependent alcohol dehydrogenase [Firmicutes bacterium HGW-Firmicutes-7]
MLNFEFENKTKVIFGRGTEQQVGALTSQYGKKVLLHYGGGSVKKYGLYDIVVNQLKELDLHIVELGDVKPNPRLTLVRQGIELCKEEKIDFILAVGGGSVIDSAKAIAVGVFHDGDVWDFYSKKAKPKKTLPVGVVLTLPAAGSETSSSSVITNEEGWFKRGLNDNLIRPVFCIMNPELTFTLPEYQTACGAADMLAHVMERYFSNTKHVDLTDRLCEATMKTILLQSPKLIDNPEDYDARAEIMWAGTLAHNNLLDTGRVGDWASHGIEHELSGIYDIAHGAGLSIIFPAWMKYVYKTNVEKFAQFASRVFNIDYNFENPEETALKGIEALENFFLQLKLPIRLADANIGSDRIAEMANKVTNNGKHTRGNIVKLSTADIEEILKLAL